MQINAAVEKSEGAEHEEGIRKLRVRYHFDSVGPEVVTARYLSSLACIVEWDLSEAKVVGASGGGQFPQEIAQGAKNKALLKIAQWRQNLPSPATLLNDRSLIASALEKLSDIVPLRACSYAVGRLFPSAHGRPPIPEKERMLYEARRALVDELRKWTAHTPYVPFRERRERLVGGAPWPENATAVAPETLWIRVQAMLAQDWASVQVLSDGQVAVYSLDDLGYVLRGYCMPFEGYAWHQLKREGFSRLIEDPMALKAVRRPEVFHCYR